MPSKTRNKTMSLNDALAQEIERLRKEEAVLRSKKIGEAVKTHSLKDIEENIAHEQRMVKHYKNARITALKHHRVARGHAIANKNASEERRDFWQEAKVLKQATTTKGKKK